MGGMFKQPKLPDPPAVKRMPVETDPDILAAAERTRASALRRKGRLSTILTDTLRGTAGADAYDRETVG